MFMNVSGTATILYGNKWKGPDGFIFNNISSKFIGMLPPRYVKYFVDCN